MDEKTARDVVLVRAIESADQQCEILSADDRRYASRSARELAQWQAADSKSEATTAQFLQQRAGLILKRIGERTPAFAALVRRRNGWQLLSVLLPLLSLLAGAVLDRITDPHRVDLLSPPLLLIIGWNLLVYLLLLVWSCLPASRARRTPAGLMRKLVTGMARLPRKLPRALSAALVAFMSEWTQLSARLTQARLSRVIHLSAALFALGAMLSLYARGLLAQYAVGWESTFLDAGRVHAILATLFLPAVTVFPLQDFSVGEIEALRFTQTASAIGGARWVHLYAATLLLLVVLPRLLLAGFAHWQARRLENHFPLDLEQPYFRKLQVTLGGVPGVLRVLPYSFTLDEARDRGLNALAVLLLGEQARLMLRPAIAYGEEPADALRDTALDDAGITLTAVLFNLAATPEQENQGEFLAYLVQHSRRGIAVMIDESSHLERIGSQPGGAARHAERIALWQQFCQFHQAPATIVNLLDPAAHALDSGAGPHRSAVA